ncbi:MAG: alginate lyase family protein [Acidimicrobiales bacterium]
MSPEEIAWRAEDRLRQELWARRRFDVSTPPGCLPLATRRAPAMPPADLSALAPATIEDIVQAAGQVRRGFARTLGYHRHDLVDPDWSLDPVSGQRFPQDRCAFRIDYRRPTEQRHVKQVWELSRHHHVTLLASAWRLTGDERHAVTAARHLTSWWERNAVCKGVNWSSGIELGIRLISWAWTRRLLDGWAGAAALFEDNPMAVHQVYWHQRYLAAFPSRGSSANNHVIAEAAGLFVAACSFPWFSASNRWREGAAQLLQRELLRNTFPGGVDREQAFEYHGLVAELALVALVEAEAAGEPLPPATWALTARMLDVVAAVTDCSGAPPRYGDGDDGRALVLDGPGTDRWRSLMAAGAAVVGSLPWWPSTVPDVRSTVLGALAGAPAVPRRRPNSRPRCRPSHFADAGLTVLRSPEGAPEEIWCRCDGGPHGHLSISAHAHADALSLELRVGGVEILVDPGTYCYQGYPEWRRYFRSTLAHNTLEVDGQDQSVAGGAFLWARPARTELLQAPSDDDGCSAVQRWTAEHDGYRRLAHPVSHRRSVVLDISKRSLRIDDRVIADDAQPHHLRLAFHLGPTIEVDLRGWRAHLRWRRPDGTPATATLLLPMELTWKAWRGVTEPTLGWYSSGFGRKEPITTLVGGGRLATCFLRTELRLGSGGPPADGASRAEAGEGTEAEPEGAGGDGGDDRGHGRRSGGRASGNPETPGVGRRQGRR